MEQCSPYLRSARESGDGDRVVRRDSHRAIIEDQTEWRQTIAGLPNPIHAAVFVLLLFTGFRKSEALTLEGKNIHEDRTHLPIMKHFLRMP